MKYVGYGALALLIIGVMFVVGLALAKGNVLFTNIETENTRASNQYRTTVDTKLVDAMQQWRDLEAKRIDRDTDASQADVVKALRAQQNALLVQMHQEAAKVGMGKVPPEVRDFLTTHPRPVGGSF